MKILWLDTETTGLDPKLNDIIQLAMIIEVGGEVKERIEYKIKPFNLHNISQEALNVNGITLQEMEGYPTVKEVYRGLIDVWGKYIDKFDKADKFIPAGYNVSFDIDFLREFFLKHDKYFGSWVWQYKPLDPLSLIRYLEYRNYLKLENHKLETICRHFGIEIKAHDAMADIEATRELVKMLDTKIVYCLDNSSR
ncbi:MAG: polymerase subunit epsilon [Planctomycetota bacterium]|nr:polymerase subunit epsilon [Planctomycetota bacterium]